MLALAREGERRGYRVVNHGYRSTRSTIDDHAVELRRAIGALAAGTDRLHFVTHSLGGIVVRAMLADTRHWPPNLGRVVMISPPNQGSELVDVLAGYRLYRLAMGSAGEALGTGEESAPNRLGPVRFELGVITGDRSLNPLFSRLIDGPSDGKVGVERARVAGMRDFLIVERSHSFIMRAPEVVAAAFRFLESGRFAG
jgi:pimeloyl-ACP methyl ester carboxylesterase